jgi:hypothetical protein
MATTYTHKKSESNYEIYRNDDHVATYDPITEEVSYTGNGKKYAVPISKEVTVIAEPKSIAPIESDPAPKVFNVNAALIKAHKYIVSLEKEVQDLKTQQRGGVAVARVPERFRDPVGDTGAPVKEPHLGDLTPDYIEWARNGGMTSEVFQRRYKGRIKDLTYLGKSK